MTQDVDVMADDPERFADDLARYLSERFRHGMAARVRAVHRKGKTLGYRVYQSRSEEHGGNRHLADVRLLDVPREHLVVTEGVQYTGPKLTMAMKAAAAASRTNEPKRLQDLADLARLIVALPDISTEDLETLWVALDAASTTRETFEDLRNKNLARETDEDSFY